MLRKVMFLPCNKCGIMNETSLMVYEKFASVNIY